MTTPLTRGLVTAVVKLPSWRRLGSEPWAAYTRGELPTSLVWYPVLGVGGVLANLAAAVAVHRNGEAARSAALPSRVVALFWPSVTC